MDQLRPALGLYVDSTVLSADEATSAPASPAGALIVTCADLER